MQESVLALSQDVEDLEATDNYTTYERYADWDYTSDAIYYRIFN